MGKAIERGGRRRRTNWKMSEDERMKEEEERSEKKVWRYVGCIALYVVD